jgi:hypothetical protein
MSFFDCAIWTSCFLFKILIRFLWNFFTCLRNFLNPYLLKKYIQNCMWSAWVFVHSCLINLSSSHPLFDKLKKLFFRLDMDLSKTLNKYTCFGIFSNLKSCLLILKTNWFLSSLYWRRSTSIINWLLRCSYWRYWLVTLSLEYSSA